MSTQFDAAYWEERYRHHAAEAHGPSPQLVDEVRDLRPGTALEAGCGEGANAIWLAGLGWSVTAVDISPSALARARRQAAYLPDEVAARIAWVEADLASWLPGAGAFDLVSSHYVHPAAGWHDLCARLAAAVAPGGTLLVVDHDHDHDHAPDPTRAHDHDHAAAHTDVQVAPDELAAALPGDEWMVEIAESRTRRAGPGGGGAVLRDAVLRARRRS
jgi:SAM-dependent methyltransferase